MVGHINEAPFKGHHTRRIVIITPWDILDEDKEVVVRVAGVADSLHGAFVAPEVVIDKMS